MSHVLAQGRLKTKLIYASALGCNIWDPAEELVVFQILCQKILRVNSYIALAEFSAQYIPKFIFELGPEMS
jgi:hypothetical protein